MAKPQAEYHYYGFRGRHKKKTRNSIAIKQSANVPALEYLPSNTLTFLDTAHGRRDVSSSCPYFHRRIRSFCLISGRCYCMNGERIVLNYQLNEHVVDLQQENSNNKYCLTKYKIN